MGNHEREERLNFNQKKSRLLSVEEHQNQFCLVILLTVIRNGCGESTKRLTSQY